MKYRGEIPGPCVAELYLPRAGDKAIEIKAQAVLSYDAFHKVRPMPQPPKVRKKGMTQAVPDFDDPKYVVSMNSYGEDKTNWMVLQSLKATPEIEWETVDPMNPQTWGNYNKELEDAGFSEFERQRIIGTVMEANALSDRKIEEARETFLSAASKAKESQSTFLPAEVSNTSSGEQPKEPASASPE